MKTIKLILLAMVLVAGVSVYAQDKAKTVKLEQTTGEFTQKKLKLKPGKYVFEVTNKGIDHEVALVVAKKKAEVTEADHIKNAYLTKTVGAGETSRSNEVVLEKGEYVYFCPMNPTPQYTIVVK